MRTGKRLLLGALGVGCQAFVGRLMERINPRCKGADLALPIAPFGIGTWLECFVMQALIAAALEEAQRLRAIAETDATIYGARVTVAMAEKWEKLAHFAASETNASGTCPISHRL